MAEVRKPIPFDVNRLDKLLDDAGIDVLVATSKHNVQYLLGDYKFFFFEAMDAIGVNRYLPAVVYQKGKPESAAYVGNSMEAYEKELGKFWPQSLYLSTWSGPETMQRVVEHIAKLGPGVRRVGIEAAFIPPTPRRRCAVGCPTSTSSMRSSRSSACAPSSRPRRSSICSSPPSA